LTHDRLVARDLMPDAVTVLLRSLLAEEQPAPVGQGDGR
jgi:hypothetical protein